MSSANFENHIIFNDHNITEFYDKIRRVELRYGKFSLGKIILYDAAEDELLNLGYDLPTYEVTTYDIAENETIIGVRYKKTYWALGEIKNMNFLIRRELPDPAKEFISLS
jgi:hypothetical protein